MRSTNVTTTILINAAMMFVASVADARATTIHSETVTDALHYKVNVAMSLQGAREGAREQLYAEPESNNASRSSHDSWLILMAGAVMIILQLRRKQKSSSATRIISIDDVRRFDDHLFHTNSAKHPIHAGQIHAGLNRNS